MANKYFNPKRPIYSFIISFVALLPIQQFLIAKHGLVYNIALSLVLAAIIGVISLRIAIQEAKDREEYEQIKAQEEQQKTQLSQQAQDIAQINTQGQADLLQDEFEDSKAEATSDKCAEESDESNR